MEREWSRRPAGLRTCMLICIGSCLFTLLSLHAFGPTSSTIASQVVTGVGFLGAGVLIHGESRVLGITTAATIWLVAAIGMTIGAELDSLAIFVTVTTLIVLRLLAPLSNWIEKTATKRGRKRDL